MKRHSLVLVAALAVAMLLPTGCTPDEETAPQGTDTTIPAPPENSTPLTLVGTSWCYHTDVWYPVSMGGYDSIHVIADDVLEYPTDSTGYIHSYIYKTETVSADYDFKKAFTYSYDADLGLCFLMTEGVELRLCYDPEKDALVVTNEQGDSADYIRVN